MNATDEYQQHERDRGLEGIAAVSGRRLSKRTEEH
jgi:hypothetical protein